MLYLLKTYKAPIILKKGAKKSLAPKLLNTSLRKRFNFFTLTAMAQSIINKPSPRLRNFFVFVLQRVCTIKNKPHHIEPFVDLKKSALEVQRDKNKPTYLALASKKITAKGLKNIKQAHLPRPRQLEK